MSLRKRDCESLSLIGNPQAELPDIRRGEFTNGRKTGN